MVQKCKPTFPLRRRDIKTFTRGEVAKGEIVMFFALLEIFDRNVVVIVVVVVYVSCLVSLALK